VRWGAQGEGPFGDVMKVIMVLRRRWKLRIRKEDKDKEENDDDDDDDTVRWWPSGSTTSGLATTRGLYTLAWGCTSRRMAPARRGSRPTFARSLVGTVLTHDDLVHTRLGAAYKTHFRVSALTSCRGRDSLSTGGTDSPLTYSDPLYTTPALPGVRLDVEPRSDPWVRGTESAVCAWTADALGVVHGPSHAEVMWLRHEDAPCLVEVGCRCVADQRVVAC
jgi:hypothetical protein